MKVTLLILLFIIGGIIDSFADQLVVYRPSHSMYALRDYSIDVESNHCKLADGDYWITDIDSPAILEASMWDSPGTTRLNVKPGDYVRIELNEARGWAGVAGSVGAGWAGSVGAQSMSEGHGPFMLSIVPESKAKQELQGLNRDCE